MSSQPIAICASGIGAALSASQVCVLIARPVISPIDEYYQTRIAIAKAAQPNILADPYMGRVLLLGLVSGVELYLRTVLSRFVRDCPICRSKAALQMLPLSAIDFYEADELELGLLEHSSLASLKELKSRVDALTGLAVPQAGPLAVAMEEYELLCELRHAAVHSGGRVGSRHARKLGVPRAAAGQVSSIQPDLKAFHLLLNAGDNLVREFNRWLFNESVARLRNEMMSGGIDKAARNRALRALTKTCYSRDDGQSGGASIRDIYRAALTV